MKKTLLQKIWLGAIIFLFASTMVYGGYLWGGREGFGQDKLLQGAENEENINVGAGNAENSGMNEEREEYWVYSELEFDVQIPTDWNGCYVYAGVLYIEYAFSEEKLPCGGYGYDSNLMPEAIFVSIFSARPTEGSEGASIASTVERVEEGVKEEKRVIVSGHEATMYLYGDGRANVLFIGEKSEPVQDYDGAIRQYADLYSISTYHYENSDIRAAFDHLLETFRIQEQES